MLVVGRASVPLPPLLAVRVYDEGLLPPAVPLNATDVAESASAGTLRALTVKVTPTVAGLPVAPPLDTRTVAE